MAPGHMPKSEEPTAPFPLQNKTTVAASTILAVTQQQEQPSDKSETRLNQPQYTSSTTQGTGFSHMRQMVTPLEHLIWWKILSKHILYVKI